MQHAIRQKLFTASSYLKYRLRAGTAHGLHSPFIFEFYTRVVDAEEQLPIFEEIEQLRKQLLHSEQEVEVTDLGAGSRQLAASTRHIRDIARYSVSRQKTSRLLFRTIAFYAPKHALELGTSLGINTLYLALAHSNSRVFTFEGCQNLAKLAAGNFQKCGAKVRISVGDLAETLPPAVHKIPSLDFVFFDANHRYRPTLDYFNICKRKAHEGSIFIFDDIYWSEEMARAWKEIAADPAVGFSVDLFHVGVIFFRKKQPKQHFVLRF